MVQPTPQWSRRMTDQRKAVWIALRDLRLETARTPEEIATADDPDELARVVGYSLYELQREVTLHDLAEWRTVHEHCSS